MWNKFKKLKERSSSHHRQPSSDIRVSDKGSEESTRISTYPLSKESGSGDAGADSIKLSSYSQASKSATHDGLTSKRSTEDPLGLVLLFAPRSKPSVDIIFIHGLGGSSLKTWSKHRDVQYCWPEKWLWKETDMETARILSFGYNAKFSESGPNSISNISDFAKTLLFEMKFGRNDAGDSYRIGERPILFVVHSMGGLVFKKAYLQGMLNDEYKSIISQIRSVLFLSTPHRGTDLATSLNRLLSVSVFNHYSKNYVAELSKGSTTLEEINETFRNVAPKLEIYSFYETLATNIGPVDVKILDKESSVLGYPGEVSQPLNADHHHVCKYSSPDDPNYKSIKTVLQTLVSKYISKRTAQEDIQVKTDIENIKSLLAISENPEDDHLALQQVRTKGTCESLLSDKSYLEWSQALQRSSILWIHAKPGSGKSVKSSFLIDHLSAAGARCQYFFFKHGDSTKRSANALFRSLAFQLAKSVPEFREALKKVSKDGIRYDKLDTRILWQKLFEATLFKLPAEQPVYWVIDALDESDAATIIVSLISSIFASKFPVRIIVTSRNLPSIASSFSRASERSSVSILCADENVQDIRLFSQTEIEYMHGDEDFKLTIVNQLVERSEGNFLWVRLALQEIVQSHSHEDIQAALKEIPMGMNSLYERMEANICQLRRPSDQKLARIILTWATYARRSLDVDELTKALLPEYPAILDIRFTISQVCGSFVVLDKHNRVSLVHQTAREYLTHTSSLPFPFVAAECHERLFEKSISLFLDPQARSKFSQSPLPEFSEYAATSWAYHLSRSSATSDAALTLLVKFLRGPFPLPWIQVLATIGQLKVLIYTSRIFTSVLAHWRKLNDSKAPMQHRLADLECLETWAIDLLKVVGKFSSYLIQDPTVIYKYVPQFCPQGSALYQQFGKSAASSFSVTGSLLEDWDDLLSRISTGSQNQALVLACFGRHLAIVTSEKTVMVWDTVTFEEIHVFEAQDHVFRICFNRSGDRLAAYGYRTTKIWSISSGRLVVQRTNPPHTRALSLSFSSDDNDLIMSSDVPHMEKLSIKNPETGWEPFVEFSAEGSPVQGTFKNSPTSVDIDLDGTYVAIAYRGSPLEVWDISTCTLVNRCKRRHHKVTVHTTNWTGVYRVIWHPSSGDVLGIYSDGIVFKWHPFTECHSELLTDANSTPSEIQCSPDGALFATSDVNGVVKLYNYQHFSMIYQLRSEDVVTAVCFSPDSRRFYDLRGSYCNVWEPNILVRFSEAEERSTDIDTEAGSMTDVSYAASDVWSDATVPITACGIRLQGALVCFGDQNGTVMLQDTKTNELSEIGSSPIGMSIECIAWSLNGEAVAYLDLSGKLKVLLVEQDLETLERFGWKYRVVLDTKVKSDGAGTPKMSFNAKATLVLVASQTSAHIYSTTAQTSGASWNDDSPDTRREWMNNPLNSEQLLAVSKESISIHSWMDFRQLHSYPISIGSETLEMTSSDRKMLARKDSEGNPISASARHNKLELVQTTSPKEHFVLISSTKGPKGHSSRYSSGHKIQLTALEVTHASSSTLKPEAHDEQQQQQGQRLVTQLPAEIIDSIERPLGILSNDRLVYIDRSLWVCSWALSPRRNSAASPYRRESVGNSRQRADAAAGKTDLAKIKRHFFLPRDWIDSENLALCHITDDGTFICPRRGKLAVIKSDLGSEW